jgi:hypothetical protein
LPILTLPRAKQFSILFISENLKEKPQDFCESIGKESRVE